MRGLSGKRVVVTGGTSGIGEATCRRFRDEGANVVSIDVDDGEETIVCDVADAAQVERAFEQIGAVDVLVANAGISIRSPFLDIREEDWRRIASLLDDSWRSLAQTVRSAPLSAARGDPARPGARRNAA